jgi:hydroxymethylpyrimidine/phosphomethylpyrimidine kinase
MRKRPEILVIGGFDPTGGAGVLADVKTAEKLKCYAFAVQTSNTIQSHDEFNSVNWVEESIFFTQLDLMLVNYDFKSVKIGLIPFAWMTKTLEKIRMKFPKIFIVWDPILSASAGFDFSQDKNIDFLNKIDLVTPNWNEIKFFGENEPKVIAEEMSKQVSVYLKGGHSKELGKDYLFVNDKSFVLNPHEGKFSEKHGSGCVLSTAMASFVAREFPLLKSCYKSKRYIERILSSNDTKLAYHS